MSFKFLAKRWMQAVAVGLLCCALSACFNLTVVSHKHETKWGQAESLSLLVRETLAPSGILRVGVYAGSPTSWVKDPKTGENVGIALELGQSLAKRLNVPVQVLEFERIAQVLDALKEGKVDFTFTNATALRAKDMDFTPALVRLELGYLVMADSPLKSVSDIDQSGIRVGVSQGSSSQAVLPHVIKQAKIIPADSLSKAQALLSSNQLDAFATNKGILFEMSDALPGSLVLDGRWGLENLAIAIPKGREAGQSFLQNFANDVKQNGELKQAIQRAGLRGTTLN